MSRNDETPNTTGTAHVSRQNAGGPGRRRGVAFPPRRGRAAQPEAVPAKGPILYRRTAETERYYRTLYQ